MIAPQALQIRTAGRFRLFDGLPKAAVFAPQQLRGIAQIARIAQQRAQHGRCTADGGTDFDGY